MVISNTGLSDDDIAKLQKQTVHQTKSSCEISEFIDKFKYKQNALQGSNDEAGLGDMLDVL